MKNKNSDPSKHNEYLILTHNLDLNSSSNNNINNTKLKETGTDTKHLNDLYNNSFDFLEIKNNFLKNLISFSFLKKISNIYQWPFLCFGNLLENSIKNYSKNFYIEFKYENRFQFNYNINNNNDNYDDDDNNNNNDKIFYLSIFDDGNGIDSENFNKIFYLNNFNENNFIEDKDNKSFLTNINIKCNLLRLCDSFIIISKTKNEMNVGLISKNFQFKLNSDSIVMPIINFNIINHKENNNEDNKEKNNNIENINKENNNNIENNNINNINDNNNNNIEYEIKSKKGKLNLKLIINEAKFIFKNENNFYDLIKKLPETGTFIYMYDFKKYKNNISELFFYFNNNNIINYTFYLQNKNLNLIDNSLIKYFQNIFLNNNLNIIINNNKIKIKNNEIDLIKNFYDELNNNNNFIEKYFILINDNLRFNNNNNNLTYEKNNIIINGNLYNGILINKNNLNLIKIVNEKFNIFFNENLIENSILIYFNNRLICKLGQKKFGDLTYYIKNEINNKNNNIIENYFGFIEIKNKGLFELTSNKSEFKDKIIFSYFYSKILNLLKNLNNNNNNNNNNNINI